jgi:hypothetical protein
LRYNDTHTALKRFCHAGTCTAGSSSFTCSWGQVVEGFEKTVVYNAFAFAAGNQSAAVSATGDTQTTGNNAQTTAVTVQVCITEQIFTPVSAMLLSILSYRSCQALL